MFSKICWKCKYGNLKWRLSRGSHLHEDIFLKVESVCPGCGIRVTVDGNFDNAEAREIIELCGVNQ